jgi:hypothetical protein
MRLTLLWKDQKFERIKKRKWNGDAALNQNWTKFNQIEIEDDDDQDQDDEEGEKETGKENFDLKFTISDFHTFRFQIEKFQQIASHVQFVIHL